VKEASGLGWRLLPSYAATAAIHQRSEQTAYVAEHPRESVAEAEQFAMTDYLTGLAAGSLEQDRFNLMSRLTGLDAQDVKRWAGRVPPVFLPSSCSLTRAFL